jgi:succinylglutamate desuccinylase
MLVVVSYIVYCLICTGPGGCGPEPGYVESRKPSNADSTFQNEIINQKSVNVKMYDDIKSFNKFKPGPVLAVSIAEIHQQEILETYIAGFSAQTSIELRILLQFADKNVI